MSLLHDADELQAIIRHSSATDDQQARWGLAITRAKEAERNRSNGATVSNARRAQAERDALDAAVLQVAGVRQLGNVKVVRRWLEAGVARGTLSTTVTSSDPATVTWPPASTLRKSIARINSGTVSPSVMAVHIQATQGAYSSVKSSATTSTGGSTT